MRGDTHSFSAEYEAAPESVRRARADLSDFVAHNVGAADGVVDDVRLAVSEAVTNAVVHAYRGVPGTVQVSAEVHEGSLSVRVRDQGCGMRPGEPVTRSSGLGLGLSVIERLADELSVSARRRGGTDLEMRFVLDAVPSVSSSDSRAFVI